MWRKPSRFLEHVKGIRSKRRRVEPKISPERTFENPYFKKAKPSLLVLLLKKYYVFFLFLAMGLGLFYFFSYSSYFQINEVVVEGNKDVSYDSIRYVVNLSFIERRWLIFQQNNLFFWDKQQAHDRLWQKFAFEELQIDRVFPGKIVIRVKEKIPGFVYVNSDRYYYTDLQGELSQAVDMQQINPAFPRIFDENSRNVEIRERVLGENIIKGIIYIQENFSKKFPVEIDHYIVPEVHCTETEEMEKEVIVPVEQGNAAASNSNEAVLEEELVDQEYKIVTTTELVDKEVACDYVRIMSDVHLVTKLGWQVYFDASGNLADQLAALQLVLNQSVEDPATLHYVDARIPSRVFYK